jgi:hypothetical protein
MSLSSAAAKAVGVVTDSSWIRVAFKLAPWVALALLSASLFATRGTLSRVRLEHQAELASRDRDAAIAAKANADRARQAAEGDATRLAAMQPLIVRSTDTVRTYAETPDGRAACLAPDRVRGLDDLDASIHAASAAPAGEGAVPADAGEAPGGR